MEFETDTPHSFEYVEKALKPLGYSLDIVHFVWHQMNGRHELANSYLAAEEAARAAQLEKFRIREEKVAAAVDRLVVLEEGWNAEPLGDSTDGQEFKADDN